MPPGPTRCLPRVRLLSSWSSASLGLGISALLPHLGRGLGASLLLRARRRTAGTSCRRSSYLARAAIAVVLLTPITLLMGGTLTLLIRHLVRSDLDAGGRRIAVLYAVNTAGAALGCFLTDFAAGAGRSVCAAPRCVAVFFNLVAAAGAFVVAWRRADRVNVSGRSVRPRAGRRPGDAFGALRAAQRSQPPAAVLTSLALALSGFAAMGMEILWFRHVSILLGGFRAVFSLLLTVILVGIGGGSLARGFLHRRTARPAAVVDGRAGTLRGASRFLDWPWPMRAPSSTRSTADRAFHVGRAGPNRDATRTFQELWFNARPILLEVGLPALLMGFGFPLAQRPHRSAPIDPSAAAPACSICPTPAVRSAAASPPASCCCRRSGSRAPRRS